MTVAPAPLAVRSHGEHANQWAWLGGGALFAFLVPFLFADLISVSTGRVLRDLLAVGVRPVRCLDAGRAA